jgi:hypothetical protein
MCAGRPALRACRSLTIGGRTGMPQASGVKPMASEIKRIKGLILSVLPPTHHAPLRSLSQANGITVRKSSQ